MAAPARLSAGTARRRPAGGRRTALAVAVPRAAAVPLATARIAVGGHPVAVVLPPIVVLPVAVVPMAAVLLPPTVVLPVAVAATAAVLLLPTVMPPVGETLRPAAQAGGGRARTVTPAPMTGG